MVQLIHSTQLDLDKWNACVANCKEGYSYFFSWYLDAVCVQWSGIVVGDYKAVMPIAWNKKWGLKYAYQPPFVQRMQLVGEEDNSSLYHQVVEIINRNFFLVDIKLNFDIDRSTPRNNCILSLNQSYEEISSKFSSQTIRNLKKGGVEIEEIQSIETFLSFYKLHTIPKIENWKTDFELRLMNLLKAAQKNSAIKIIAAKVNGNIEAMNVLIYSNRRIINLLPSSAEIGRTSNAMSFILSHIFQIHQNSPIIFDFEGSEIPGIARFYEGFGANKEFYFHYKRFNIFSVF